MSTATLLEESVVSGLRTFTDMKGLFKDREFDGREHTVQIRRFGDDVITAVLDKDGGVLIQHRINFSFNSCVTLAQTVDGLPINLTKDNSPYAVAASITEDTITFEVTQIQPIHYHT